MKTAVVILNWNTERYLRAFLPALVASCPEDAEVIVADSGSADGSLEFLSREFPGLRTIALGSNYGFTGGYNRALAQVEAEYYLLVNSDIMVSPGWLEPLVEYMDTHPRCGICGPKLHALLPHGDGWTRTDIFEYAGAAGGRIDRYGYPFCRGRVLKRTEPDRGQYDRASGILWVSGACLLTRSSLWRDLGGLDGRFFAHMEEIDYCWRAQLRGYTVDVIPQSTVWHLGGGTLAPDSPWKLELNYRNNLLLLDNNLPSTIGRRKAYRRIRFRMFLDGVSALIYLFSFRPACFRAVWRAHKGYRKLRSPERNDKVSVAGVDGYFEINIILQSLLRGGGIFTYLRRYEDSY
ncbi:MAG: glycosyltransferase family 2 protein [Bacteroidales bacterium]|nr:glycosyltransferase family 2 protein [Bacteroidales bacterium]